MAKSSFLITAVTLVVLSAASVSAQAGENLVWVDS